MGDRLRNIALFCLFICCLTAHQHPWSLGPTLGVDGEGVVEWLASSTRDQEDAGWSLAFTRNL
jgi:hypothetical protein